MTDIDHNLERIARYIDISPSDYKRAVERFTAVGNWLSNGNYHSGTNPQIYLQGSFRLGTVIRPYHGDKDGDFDIDQVCEILNPIEPKRPNVLKHDVGDRLKEHANYHRMLDEEGKRCWTLKYSSENDRPGFHIDVLPAVSKQTVITSRIDITDKVESSYAWSRSDPIGYYRWFKSRNGFSELAIESQTRYIHENNPGLFDSEKEVPKQLVRTPLQQAIQIMKRHRDVHFANKDSRPISIIITTITTHLYSNQSISALLGDFVKYLMARHEQVMRDVSLPRDSILDFENGEWLVENPADRILGEGQVENFANKWNEDAKLSVAFFDWVHELNRVISAFHTSGVSSDLNLKISQFGEGDTFPSIVASRIRLKHQDKISDTDSLLEAIHLGISGDLDWTLIKEFAQSEFNLTEGTSKDVARINFYQLYLHQGIKLSNSDVISDIENLMKRNKEDAGFTMCGNILLGSVTPEMISNCIKRYGETMVMGWPIMRTLSGELTVPHISENINFHA